MTATVAPPDSTDATNATLAAADEPAQAGLGTGWALLRAEVALALVTATLAITFARLFRSGAFLPRLLLVVIVAHFLAALARRRRLPLAVSLPLLVIAAGLLFSWLYLPGTLRAGFPTGHTLSQARTLLDGAFSPFRRLVPPVPVTTGFEITMAIGLWVLATFADAAAFSGDAPVQALVPHAAAFLGSSIFARGRDDIIAAAGLTAATLVFFAAHRAVQASKRHWVQLEQRRGAAALFGAGAGLALVAVVAAALLVPHIPGVNDKPVVDLRTIGKSPGPIEVGNPLVGVGNMLGAQSDQLFFKIKAKAPHYWRLTSLEEFDSASQQWKTRRSYRDATSGEPLGAEPTSQSTTETDRVTLSALPGIWLPTPFQPKEITTGIDIRYDSGSSSVIASGRSTLPNVSYDVTAAIPSDVISASTRRDTHVDPVYLAAPHVSPFVKQVLDRVTGSKVGDVAKLQALQAYFRETFQYSTDVDYSHQADPTKAFLQAQVGFCQQFASTFALMARMLGIPSRVAVGFTYGEETGAKDAQGRTTYSVRGREAHAWPEVHLSGIGWVAFEPTPGRGNPDATPITGVKAEQAAVPASDPNTTTTTAPGGHVPATTTPSSGRIHLNENQNTSGTKKPVDKDSGTGRVALVAGLVLVVLMALVVAARAALVSLRRRRRRGKGTSPASRVRVAWLDSCEWLGLLAIQPARSETPTEFGRRASGAVPVENLVVLAQLETERLFGDQPLAESAAGAAEAVVTEVRAVVIDRTDRRQRLAHLMGWEKLN